MLLVKEKKKKDISSKSHDNTKCSEMWSRTCKGKNGKRKRGYFKVDTKVSRKSKIQKSSIDNADNWNTNVQKPLLTADTIPHCPWGGTVGDVTLFNTCTIDNLLFAVHYLIKQRSDVKIWLETCNEPVANTLLEVSTLFTKGEWSAGKLCWITANNLSNADLHNIDVYGTESDKFVKYYGQLQKTVCLKQCTKAKCSTASTLQSDEILLPLVTAC
jgi:hypothetical protein